MFDISNI